MSDVFSKEKRSEIMSKIRSTSQAETRFSKLISGALYHKGFRYRRNYSKIPGSPDIVFVSRKIAIFFDGTFWHGYHFDTKINKLRSKYWKDKISKNIARDKKQRNALRRQGWKIIRIWEHDFRKNPKRTVQKILRVLKVN
jgi:DNA mismatch endonuclease, patch repair protein